MWCGVAVATDIDLNARRELLAVQAELNRLNAVSNAVAPELLQAERERVEASGGIVPKTVAKVERL